MVIVWRDGGVSSARVAILLQYMDVSNQQDVHLNLHNVLVNYTMFYVNYIPIKLGCQEDCWEGGGCGSKGVNSRDPLTQELFSVWTPWWIRQPTPVIKLYRTEYIHDAHTQVSTQLEGCINVHVLAMILFHSLPNVATGGKGGKLTEDFSVLFLTTGCDFRMTVLK